EDGSRPPVLSPLTSQDKAARLAAVCPWKQAADAAAPSTAAGGVEDAQAAEADSQPLVAAETARPNDKLAAALEEAGLVAAALLIASWRPDQRKARSREWPRDPGPL